MSKIYKIFLSFVTLLYPVGIIFDVDFLDFIILILGILWGVNIIFSDQKILSFLVSLFFTLSFYLESKMLSYFYPVMINAFFLYIFSKSLKTTPIITKFAMMKDKNLNLFAKKYTKNLTKIWCLFFVVNGLIAFSLIFIEDKSYWAYYNGFLSYVFIGLFFMVEYLIRIILKRRFDG